MLAVLLMTNLTVYTNAAHESGTDSQQDFMLQDSREIDPDIKSVLQTEGANEVVQLYSVSSLYGAFATSKTVSEAVSDAFIEKIYIVWDKTGEAFTSHNKVDGSGLTLRPATVPDSKFRNSHQYIEAVSDNIEIQNEYYIHSPYHGQIIYYETNDGDYVYYSNPWTELLCSKDVFWDYMTKKYEYILEHPYDNFGNGDDGRWYLEPYDMQSWQFNPNAELREKEEVRQLALVSGVVFAVVVIGSVATFLIVYKKKKA